MKVVYVKEQQELIGFVERAAKRFAEEPQLYSYTDGEIKAGELLALRWGMHERAVLVLKLDENFEPVIYGDVVKQQP